jgi:hypothetical protein
MYSGSVTRRKKRQVIKAVPKFAKSGKVRTRNFPPPIQCHE